MERAVAIKKLTKLLGKKLGWRIDADAPSQEERDAAKAELAIVVAHRDKLKAQRDTRYRQILEADAEYQSLLEAHRAASKAADELFYTKRRYKITVGLNEGWCFVHKAEGDSWEEVIEKVESKLPA